MARYKPYSLKQDKFTAVSYADQIVPGSFESALNETIEPRRAHEIPAAASAWGGSANRHQILLHAR